MGLNWEWFSFYPLVSPGFRPEPDQNTVELILKVCLNSTLMSISLLIVIAMRDNDRVLLTERSDTQTYEVQYGV